MLVKGQWTGARGWDVKVLGATSFSTAITSGMYSGPEEDVLGYWVLVPPPFFTCWVNWNKLPSHSQPPFPHWGPSLPYLIPRVTIHFDLMFFKKNV